MKIEKIIENGIEYKIEIDVNGDKHWYLNGQRHREDGPAIEDVNGSKYWYLNNKFHREDGPAIEWADGSKSWYLNGKAYSEQEYWEEIENRKPRPIKLPRFQQIGRNNEKHSKN